VVAAVLGDDPVLVAATLSKVRRQVYEPTRVVIAGDAGSIGALAERLGVGRVSTAADVVAGLEAAEAHVWFLRAGAEPRPDALRTLVAEADRVDAGVAGSKLLRAEQPERLLSVGVATDVFDEPYLGLDDDEIDHGQYDVVRDVAAVSGASLLIRRDLARGLGGPDPSMAPGAAAIDLCQRARLRGARVVVVPSSEVALPADQLDKETWREEAGRVRAMLKVYSWVTLAWALPLRFVIGLVDAVLAPLSGRWSAFRFVGGWLWALATVPGSLAARSAARGGRAVGDDELFRFQLRGSARLRELGAGLGSTLRSRLDSEEGIDFAALGRDLTQPAMVVGLGVLAFLFTATRSLWSAGFPAARFSLPLGPSGWDAAAAYAGGWNPGGFGSIEPLPPFVGLAGVVQVLVFDDPQRAAAIVVVASMALGIVGFGRLARGLGIDLIPGAAAGLVLVAGPAARAVADAGAIPALVGLGILPWAVRTVVAPWPPTTRRRVGRAAGTVFVLGLMAIASPLLLVAAVAVVVVAVPAGAASPGSLVRATLGAVFAMLALFPWIARADLADYVTAGEAFWEPGVALTLAAGMAAAAALLAGPENLARAAIWGSVIAAAGGWVARLHDLGAGREVEHAALAVVALGSALVVGAILEAARRVESGSGWDRVVVGLGAVAALALVFSTALVILPGRGGLPADELRNTVRFIDAAGPDASVSRVLLVGPAEALPGEVRSVRGAHYRVTSAPLPFLAETWLPAPVSSDEALEGVLAAAIDGETFRIGEKLASFGVRWIVLTGETPLEAILRSQLDLVPLEGLARPAFIVDEAVTAVRAVTTGGEVWAPTTWGFEGEPAPGQRLWIGETADPRWGPGVWSQQEWGNEVDAATGEARFGPIEERRTQARAVGIAMLALLGVAWWGRRG
jgi:hypothetical protein